MRLRNGIYFDGIAQDGSYRFFAYVKDKDAGEYIERLRVYGHSKSQSIKQANEYFAKFSISI